MQVLYENHYDEDWNIDYGFSHHVTRSKKCLRDFTKLNNVGLVKFRNNKCTVQGYRKSTNGNFTLNGAAYGECLQHNLICESQLVIGTRNHVLFDRKGSVIYNKTTNDVFFKFKQKGYMFTLYMKHVIGLP